MNHQKPMTRDQLHEIAAGRRGDEDVRALLLEIKRLRELTVAAFQRGSRALRYTEDANAAEAQERFAELFEDEPAIMELLAPLKAPLPGPERRWPHLPEEREARLLARMRRG